MDRYDEEILAQEEDRFNLYKQGDAVKAQEVPGDPSKPQTNEQENWFAYLFSPNYRDKMKFYSLSEFKGLQPINMDSPDLKDKYAIMAICWRDNAPVLRFYQRLFNSKAVEFSFPLDKYNSRIVSKDESGTKREIIISLRQGTILPWIMMDDYEIFRITVNEDAKTGIWEIEKVEMLTENRIDDIQPLLSASGSKIVFTSIDDGKASVKIMDGNGTNPFTIDEKASMPCFLPGTDDVIFVKEDENELRDFYVYKTAEKKIRKADTAEIVATVRELPYASLKAKYMTIGAFRRSAKPDISDAKKITYEEIISAGLRGSPEILRDYYEYESAMAKTVENLYDQGPDAFFSSNYLADNYIFLKKPEGQSTDNVGDVISMENFLRLTGGMTVPVIPNVHLKLAEYARDRYAQEAAKLQFQKTVNDSLAKFNGACFDYIMWVETIGKYSHAAEIAMKRYEKFKIQKDAGYNIKERVLFAENEFNAAQTEYDNAVESFIGSQYKINELLGLNITKPLQIEYPENDKLFKAEEVPALEYFQAQAQINHPDIQKMNFMLLGASAIRDMGPPALRTDGVKISISYGYGIDKWSKAIDDFLLLSLAHTFPLRLPILGRSYYDNWTSKIESLRNEKFRIQGEVKTNVHSAYKDIVVLKSALETQRARTELFRERVRIGAIYSKVGNLEFQTAMPDVLNISQINDIDTNEIELMKNEAKLFQMRCEYFKKLSNLYAASGISSKLVSQMLAHMKIEKREKESTFVNGLYLLEPLEIITSKEKRDEFLAFCRQYSVNNLNCLVSDEEMLRTYDLELKYFIVQCRERNIEVNALIKANGELGNEQSSKLQRLAKSIVQFGSFSGIDLDMRPYLAQKWENEKQRTEICGKHIELAQKISELCGRNNLSVEMPLFLKDQDTAYGKFPEALSRYAGTFNVSALKASPESLEALCKDKKITSRINASLDLRTPHANEHNLADMRMSSFSDMKSELCGKLRKFSNFGGSVVNDYGLLKDMKN